MPSAGVASLSIPSGCPGGPAGDIEKQQARPERALGGPLEPRIPPDTPTLSLAEVSLPLPSNEDVHPRHPTEQSAAEDRCEDPPGRPGTGHPPAAHQHLASPMPSTSAATSASLCPHPATRLRGDVPRPGLPSWPHSVRFLPRGVGGGARRRSGPHQTPPFPNSRAESEEGLGPVPGLP